jgi:acyl-CoA thioesterase-2
MNETALPMWDGREIADLLALEPLPQNRFRSRCAERNEHDRIYGGQLLGQALMAAALTVGPDRPATYLQFLFAAGGIPQQGIDYEVAVLQDGKRFASRNVRGSQPGGRIVSDASVTFAKPFEAPAHQAPPPADCGLDRDPEGLPGFADIDAPEARAIERTLGYSFRPHFAIDFRAPFLEDLLRPNLDRPRMRYWIKLRAPLPDDRALHAAAFAYLSDYWINFVACIAHVASTVQAGERLYVASLNHAIWFHRPLRADQWLLFDCVSPSGAFGRGLAVGRVYSRSGEMVASATQECLLAPTTGAQP